MRLGIFAVVPVEETQSSYGEMKEEMGRRVIDKITRLAPDFESLILRHTSFTPKHMGTMFGAPGGDYCHGLIHPDQMAPIVRARKAMWISQFRSMASALPAQVVTAGPASRSSPATTRPSRHWPIIPDFGLVCRRAWPGMPHEWD